MKVIIMLQTLNILGDNPQEELNKLIIDGFVVKRTEKLTYLIKVYD